MIFALAGNQNCGKTTLFNALTGSNQHVGNFPGVTVDQKMGDIRGEKNCSVVDLPGIYSLRPYTQEEIVTRDFILNQKPDGIINIVDATNIERNLYLTLQLLELRVPMVLALNMMDEVRANGGSIDVQKMSAALGIPVVPISAAKGEGVSELITQALTVARGKILPKVTDFCTDDSAVHRCLHAVIHLISDHAERLGVPTRFCAAKLIEGGDTLEQDLRLDENEKELLEHCIVQMENETGLDRNAALADMRYTFIEGVVAASVTKCHESREHARSVRFDQILTGRYTAIPSSSQTGSFLRPTASVFPISWPSALMRSPPWSMAPSLPTASIRWSTASSSMASLPAWAACWCSCPSSSPCFSFSPSWKTPATWPVSPL